MVAKVAPVSGIDTRWPARPTSGERGAEADDGGDDRKAHRDDAAEHQGEDQHRREDPDDFTALGRLVGQLAADGAGGLDLDPGLAGRVGGVEDLLRDLLVELTGADVEQDGREGGLAVLRQQAGRLAVAADRVGDAVDVLAPSPSP